MQEITESEAIAFALSRHPDNIGVGRLCQELLASVVASPITTPAAAPSLGMSVWQSEVARQKRIADALKS